MSYPKQINLLSLDERRHFPVWQFVSEISSREMDETWVFPVLELPVADLLGRVAVTEVKLANGRQVMAALANVRCQDCLLTSLFLSATFYSEEKVFHLARYFDPNYDEHGPKGLAEFIGYEIDDVFPISYDLSDIAVGEATALKATIEREPQRRLSDDELVALLV